MAGGEAAVVAAAVAAGNTPGVGSAVPEPATWASLLIGFFAIGFGLRGAATRQPRYASAGALFSNAGAGLRPVCATDRPGRGRTDPLVELG